MTTNLRDFARKFEALDGAVTFWMLEFSNRDSEIAYDELAREYPERKWVHSETGEETFTDPHTSDLDDSVKQAQRKASKWDEVYLWSNSQNIFIMCDPITVDIEFKSKKLSAELKALQHYWDNRNGHHLHNWDMFRQLVGRQVANAWFEAYSKTRDESFAGPEALQSEPGEDADPNA